MLGMVGVGDQKCLLVEKHCLRLLERNPVPAPVLRVLSVVPLEAKHGHPMPMYLQCKEISIPSRSGNDLLALHNQAASTIAVSFIK